MALKHQEYRHTFYRVTPNMCIIYRMRNDCLCWLFLVTVYIIRECLPVTELPFSAGNELGRCTAPSTVFSQPYGKKRSFGVCFMVPRVNAYSKWIRCTGILNTCTYFDMTRYDVIAFVTWVGKWHHSTFFLKFVSCVIIWYKNVPLETSMKRFKGESILWKFALYFN